MNTEDARRMLQSEGFVCLRRAVLIPEHEERRMRKIKTGPIFNNIGGPNDRRRQQGSLNLDKTTPLVAAQLRSVVTCVLGPAVKVKTAFVLKSLPGCAEQSPHMDLPPGPDSGKAGGALLALEDAGTTLEVWPRSHLPEAQCIQTQVHLFRGDLLLFRGDFVHAGSAYPNGPNTRVHAFLDHENIKRSPNRTFEVRKHGDEMLRRRIQSIY